MKVCKRFRIELTCWENRTKIVSKKAVSRSEVFKIDRGLFLLLFFIINKQLKVTCFILGGFRSERNEKKPRNRITFLKKRLSKI